MSPLDLGSLGVQRCLPCRPAAHSRQASIRTGPHRHRARPDQPRKWSGEPAVPPPRCRRRLRAFLAVHLGRFSGPFGLSWGPLGPSRDPLGPSWRAWAVLGVSGGPLGDLLWPPVALLGLSWEAFGTHWGPSWAVLGPSWAVFELSWAVLGLFRGPLGPSWGGLEGLWGRLGTIFWASWGVLGPRSREP